VRIIEVVDGIVGRDGIPEFIREVYIFDESLEPRLGLRNFTFGTFVLGE